jgi:arginine utilization protein RocB
MATTYEQAIKKLELARRLALGPNYTTKEEKKMDPEKDKLIIKALKERYREVTDKEAWIKFGAKLITTAQSELKLITDKIEGRTPPQSGETIDEMRV